MRKLAKFTTEHTSRTQSATYFEYLMTAALNNIMSIKKVPTLSHSHNRN